jgi:hypothetical protein
MGHAASRTMTAELSPLWPSLTGRRAGCSLLGNSQRTSARGGVVPLRPGRHLARRDGNVWLGCGRQRNWRCWRGCRIRRGRPVHPAPDPPLLGHRGRRPTTFVYPHSLGGRFGIVCGDVGPYARVGCGYQRWSSHEIRPEGVRRDEVTRDAESTLVTSSPS